MPRLSNELPVPARAHDRPLTVVPSLPVEAAADDGRSRLLTAVAVGFFSSLFYLGWWLQDGRLADPLTLILLVAAGFWVASQVWCAWAVYLRMDRAAPAGAAEGLSVDVFLPVYDEPADLVEAALRAAQELRYPHRTILLDDSPDQAYRLLAHGAGVDYRAREDRAHAKAGNVNHALEQSNAEFVVIFDIDHLPEPHFLDGVLGHFADDRIGFVQRGIAFRNAGQSWIAHAAADQAADPYGPISQGMHGCGAAPVWGSHTTFRRTALDSIGGYRPGLAEDLHTSVRLHAAGWSSVFLPDAAATGLVPFDLLGMYKQQFKWARGVFEVALGILPRALRSLSVPQSVAYLLRTTYYTIGAVFLIHCAAALALLASGSAEDRTGFSLYLLFAVPLAASFVAVRSAAMAQWRGRATASHWRSYVLTLLMWPVHVAALLAALLRLPIHHITTPKRTADRQPFWLWLPQALLGVGLLAAALFRVHAGWQWTDLPVLLFAVGTALLQLVGIVLALRNRA